MLIVATTEEVLQTALWGAPTRIPRARSQTGRKHTSAEARALSTHAHVGLALLKRAAGAKASTALLPGAALSGVEAAAHAAAHWPLVTYGPSLWLLYSLGGILTASFGAWIVQATQLVWSHLEPHVIHNELIGSAESCWLYGVDVSSSKHVKRPELQRAVDFAAKAHEGQVRRTGTPYVSHVVETALIVEQLLAASSLGEVNARVEEGMVAALLHDVLDDTEVTEADLREAFGDQVGDIVTQVSQLSNTNQLMRRQRREKEAAKSFVSTAALSGVEEHDLRVMILSMVNEPLVILVKLADRLHNMRTVWALPADRRLSLATETLQLWCSIAERLGLFNLKSELEDLCYAVLEPVEYLSTRRLLDSYLGLKSDQAEEQEAAVQEPAPVPQAVLATRGPAGVERLPALVGNSSSVSERAASLSSASSFSSVSPSSRYGSYPGPRGSRLYGRQGRRSQGSSMPYELVQARAQAALAVSEAAIHLSGAGPANRLDSVPLWGPPDGLPGDGVSQPEIQTVPGFGAQTAARERQERLTNRGPRERQALRKLQSSYTADVDRGGGSSVSAGGSTGSPQKLMGVQSGIVSLRGNKKGPRVFLRVNTSKEAVQAPRDTQSIRAEHQVRELIETVPPFTAISFHRYTAQEGGSGRPSGIEPLHSAAARLVYEMQMESQATGLDVRVEGRLKSLYGLRRKMARKNLPLMEVCDVRALRVVIDDEGGTNTQAAVEACYQILPTVQRLWRPIRGEFDDYIAQPKSSGYQSLHTAVLGPGAVPMEVQIRTSSMHENAEYGQAAHWAYKDCPTAVLPGIAPDAVQSGAALMKVDGGRLTFAVCVEREGNSMLAVVRPAAKIQPTDHVPARVCREMLAYVRFRKWCLAGHGDLQLCLERYELHRGRWHRIDAYGVKTREYMQPLLNQDPPKGSPPGPAGQGTAAVAAASLPGKTSQSASTAQAASMKADAVVKPVVKGLGGREVEVARSREGDWLMGKIVFLRKLLEQGPSFMKAQIDTLASTLPAEAATALEEATSAVSLSPEEPAGPTAQRDISVVVWPRGGVMTLQRGTTAGDIIRQMRARKHQQEDRHGTPLALGGETVNVNNRLVPEDTLLHDGDYVVLTKDFLKF